MDRLGWLRACAALSVLVAACSLDRTPAGGQGAYALGDGMDASSDVPGDGDGDGDAAADDPLGDASTMTKGDGGASDVDATVVDPPDEVLRFDSGCATDRDCVDDEICLASTGLTGRASYCAQACSEDADCGESGGGGNSPICASTTQDGRRCRLPCDAILDNTCPDGMQCRDVLLIFSGGSCVFDG